MSSSTSPKLSGNRTSNHTQWLMISTGVECRPSSGATAVQIVWSSRRGSRSIEHLGSAHDEAELAALKAAAAQRLAADQAELHLGVAGRPGSVPFFEQTRSLDRHQKSARIGTRSV